MPDTGSSDTPRAHKLYPPPAAETDLESIYLDIDLQADNSLDPALPRVMINMVSSLDGITSVDGKADGIGGRSDRRVMRNLRAISDAVIRGANTLRAERISAGVPADLARIRTGKGLPKQPIEIIVTNTGIVPISTNLLNSTPDRTIILTGPGAGRDRTSELAEHATVIAAPATADDGMVDMNEALRILKTKYGIDTLLVEGGPRLNYDLIFQDLVDHLFLTLAPKLIGGTSSTSQSSGSGDPLSQGLQRRPHLVSIHECEDEVFLHYKLRPQSTKTI